MKKLRAFKLLTILLLSTGASAEELRQDQYGRWVNSAGGNIYGDSMANQEANPMWNQDANPMWNSNADPNWNPNANPMYNSNSNPMYNSGGNEE